MLASMTTYFAWSISTEKYFCYLNYFSCLSKSDSWLKFNIKNGSLEYKSPFSGERLFRCVIC